MTPRPLRLRWLALALAACLLGGCQDEQTRIQEHLERADAYAEEEAWPEAIIEYKSALQLDPNVADAHYGLAKAYLETSKLRQGYWELRETVRLAPDNLDARLQFAQLSRLAGEFEESLAQADAILALEPEHETAHILRGQALQGLDRPEEAVAAYQRAREVSDEPAATLLLANFHRARGERAAAEPLYRELTERDPTFAAGARSSSPRASRRASRTGRSRASTTARAARPRPSRCCARASRPAPTTSSSSTCWPASTAPKAARPRPTR